MGEYKDLEGLELELKFPTKITPDEEEYRKVIDYLEQKGSKHKKKGYDLYVLGDEKGEIICGRVTERTLEFSVDLDEKIKEDIERIRQRFG